MNRLSTLFLPPLGGKKTAEVIQLLVQIGERVTLDEPIMTLETEKASVDIPSTVTGTLQEILVQVGDTVAEGQAFAQVEVETSAMPDQPSAKGFSEPPTSGAVYPSVQPPEGMRISQTVRTALIVIGGGPGGYTAAFRAADLGMEVTLVEQHRNLGGVCLNVGCIPSKALLHVAKVLTDAEEAQDFGLQFGRPTVDINRVRLHKESIVTQLVGGLNRLAAQRKVNVVRGRAQFSGPKQLVVDTEYGLVCYEFEQAIVAVGSTPTKLPSVPYEDPRILDSTSALQLSDIPEQLLVVGGGIIGLELATVYDAFGSKVTVIEHGDQLIPGADPDIVQVLQKRIQQRYTRIALKTTIEKIEAKTDGIWAHFLDDKLPAQRFDRALIAIGRHPNGGTIHAELAGLQVDGRGFIPVDKSQRTNVPHIFAIGDVSGSPMLAHKATHEAKVAAENAAGHRATFDAKTIPSVAYTDPEIAWMGLTEQSAQQQGVRYEAHRFPWAASGRAICINRSEGVSKILVDPETKRLLGAAIVGVNAGELLAEAVLALEMGADIHDIALTIHAHPTLSETFGLAAEIAAGTITDLLPSRSPSKSSPT